MRYSNLHNHSDFSDGKHSLEENVRSAIEKNMLSLGFSDHSFTACDTSYCMKLEQYDEYLEKIARLKQEYRTEIPLYAGLELDYYSQADRSAFDYLLASVHYIIRDGVCYPIDHSPQQQLDCIRDAFHGSVLDMAKCYYDMLTEHVEKTRPAVVGHFDVITKFSLMPEEDEKYQRIAAEALQEILKYCPYVEMNTGAISRGWRKVPYLNAQLLDVMKQNGGEVVLGSDSHHRDNLTFFFDECVEILKDNGIDHISVFNGTGFDKMAI